MIYPKFTIKPNPKQDFLSFRLRSTTGKIFLDYTLVKIVVSTSLNNNFYLIFDIPVFEISMKGFMYILECSNGKYYVGSTQDLKSRIREHQDGKGANFTRKFLPVRLVYFEEFNRIDEAFNREKQVQGWSRKKKEALMYGAEPVLPDLSECKNESHYKKRIPDPKSPTE